MNSLDLVENRIKSLIQKSAAFFPWTDKSTDLMSRLLESIQTTLLENSNSSATPPYRFIIKMNSDNLQKWQKHRGWDDDLAHAYETILNEHGLVKQLRPAFTLVVKNSLADDEILIEELPEEEEKDETSSILARKGTSKVSPPASAPLLLFGQDTEVRLEKSVITLGRHSSNDIVVSDGSVSRMHAQIRHVNDGYILFDAGSSAGTFVNGNRISQKRLQTGDVISLGSVDVIFLAESEGAEDSSNSTYSKGR
jgi:hypothetical protein